MREGPGIAGAFVVAGPFASNAAESGLRRALVIPPQREVQLRPEGDLEAFWEPFPERRLDRRSYLDRSMTLTPGLFVCATRRQDRPRLAPRRLWYRGIPVRG